jgi:hypothetical protein
MDKILFAVGLALTRDAKAWRAAATGRIGAKAKTSPASTKSTLAAQMARVLVRLSLCVVRIGFLLFLDG